MRNVHLHGQLAEKYGPSFRFAVDTPVAAVRLFEANFPGFRRTLYEGHYRVVAGDLAEGLDLDAGGLSMMLGRNDLHIVPVASGRGSGKGTGKAILGAIIVVTAFVLAPATGGASAGAAAGAAGAAAGSSAAATGLGATAFTIFGSAVTYGNIALFGAVLALSGVTQLLSPQQVVNDYSERETPDQRPSFLYNGPVNTTEQGGIRPLVFGRMLVGSVVISGGLQIEQI